MTPWLDFAASVTIFTSFLIPLTIWIIYNIYRVRVICNLAHDTQEEALDLLIDYYKSMAIEESQRYNNLNLYLFDCGDFISPIPDGCEIYHETTGLQTYADIQKGTYMEWVGTRFDPFGQEEMSDVNEYKGTNCKAMFGMRTK